MVAVDPQKTRVNSTKYFRSERGHAVNGTVTRALQQGKQARSSSQVRETSHAIRESETKERKYLLRKNEKKQRKKIAGRGR